MKTIEKTELIPVEAVIIHWAESKLVPVENVEYPSFKKANQIVEMIAAEERRNEYGGYCKLKYTVKWADGKKWTGRIDITGDMYGESNYIQSEIESDALFMSGVRPSHMSERDYAEVLLWDEITKEQQEKMKSFLKNYSLEKGR